MTGQGNRRSSGVPAVGNRGQARRGQPHAPSEPPSAVDLFHGTTMVRVRRPVSVRPEDIEIVVAPEWLADLHDPRLVISPGYVGTERRQVDRVTSGYTAPAGRVRRARWQRQIAKIVGMTLVIAIPLTVVAGRSGSASTGNPPPANRTTAKTAAAPGHHASRLASASSRRAAKAQAASRRAAAHQRAADGLAVSPSGTRAARIVRSTGGAAVAQHQATQTAAARSHQQAAQARALVRAAAMQRRTEMRVARAAAQAPSPTAAWGGIRRHPGGASSITLPGS